MSRRSSHLVIGLFVSIGAIIGAAAIFWLGASKYFEKGDLYVTYFDESVQGLQADSSVKYRGVDIGRVKEIGVAPDNRLIEVTIKINLRGEIDQTVVSQLRTAGITGIVYIELDRKQPGEPDLSPEIGFPARYPVIPSRPSEIKQILSKVDDIVENIKEIDFQALSDQLESAFKSTENFFGGSRMQGIMISMESMTTNLDRTITQVNTLMEEGRFEDILTETRSALVEARTLMKTAREELNAMKLSQTTGKADRLVENLDRRTRSISNEMRTTGESLRRTSESLERLLERLNNSPSDLLFSSPPPPDRAN